MRCEHGHGAYAEGNAVMTLAEGMAWHANMLGIERATSAYRNKITEWGSFAAGNGDVTWYTMRDGSRVVQRGTSEWYAESADI